MSMSKLLSEEISQIQNDTIRRIVREFFLTEIPKYFWSIPSSSSGKYHPSFAQGEQGLVRHTKMVCTIAKQLLEMREYSEIDRDVVIAACLLHDTFKQGYENQTQNRTLEEHPKIAATEFYDFAVLYSLSSEEQDKIDLIHQAILCHMGQWYDYMPITPTEKLVHLADYLASRKFFDLFKNE